MPPSRMIWGSDAGIAEHVGDPDLGRALAQVLLEEPLPVGDLADERLGPGQVRVGLDPHATDRDPSPLGRALLDALEDGRVAVDHPLVLGRLRAPELELRVVVHQGQHVAERAGALALRLADRPQPRRVDVGVADGGDAVRRRHRRPGQDLGQLGPGRRRGTGDVVEHEHVEHPLERPQDLVAPGLVERQLAHELVEGADVLAQLDHVDLDEDQLRPGQRVDRRGAGGQQVRVGVRPVRGQVRVGRRLDQERHRLAPAAGSATATSWLNGCSPRRGTQVPEPSGRSPHSRPSAWKPGELVKARLMLASTRRPAQSAGTSPVHPEPGGAPRPTPRAADGERLVGRPSGRRSPAPVRPAPPTPRRSAASGRPPAPGGCARAPRGRAGPQRSIGRHARPERTANPIASPS